MIQPVQYVFNHNKKVVIVTNTQLEFIIIELINKVTVCISSHDVVGLHHAHLLYFVSVAATRRHMNNARNV